MAQESSSVQLAKYTLNDLFEFARESGLVAQQTDLSPHQLGRARKDHDDPAEQLISMDLAQPGSDEPLAARTLYQALAASHGYPFETIDPLVADPDLITGIIGKEFARKRLVVPYRRAEDGTVVIAAGNPLDTDAIDTVAGLVPGETTVILAYPGDILRVIREHYGLRKNLTQAGKSLRANTATSAVNNLEQLLQVRSDSELEQSEHHIVNAVEYLFRYAIDQNASDIHFEPKRENGLVRLRIDGIMHTVHTVPMNVYRALASRIKTISRMDIAERRRPQDGRLKLQGGANEIEMRVSTLPVVFGEKIVLRIFDPTHVVDDFAELGFSSHQEEAVQQMLRSGHGMMIVTGPTGSGKSTTLYCALQQLARQPVNITTIEDPVEMVIEALNQVPVQTAIGVDFAHALRTILRQDPDIIMVGEIRDAETARYAVQAALTGHLVLSTLHTNHSYAAIGRLIDLGVDRFFLAQVMRGITAQRLVRTVCQHCAIDVQANAQLAAAFGDLADGFDFTVKQAVGCEHCRQTGYKGRTSLQEILPFTEEVAQLVYQESTMEAVIAAARKAGYETLKEAAYHCIRRGDSTPEETIRVLAGSVV